MLCGELIKLTKIKIFQFHYLSLKMEKECLK